MSGLLIFTCSESFLGPGLDIGYFKAQLFDLVIIAVKIFICPNWKRKDEGE